MDIKFKTDMKPEDRIASIEDDIEYLKNGALMAAMSDTMVEELDDRVAAIEKNLVILEGTSGFVHHLVRELRSDVEKIKDGYDGPAGADGS